MQRKVRRKPQPPVANETSVVRKSMTAQKSPTRSAMITPLIAFIQRRSARSSATSALNATPPVTPVRTAPVIASA